MSANWVKIASSIEELAFNENGLTEVVTAGKTICIGRVKDRLFAFAQKCPHASGLLVAGWIDAMGNIVCPLHRYKFCMANGRNVSGEGYRLKHWLIEERSDGIWVEFKDLELLELLSTRY